MAAELLDKTHQLLRGEKPVISARRSAEILNLSKAVFFSAIDSDVIQWQAKIQDEPDDKPAYGFAIQYLQEVLKVLPKKRGKTQRVFTSEVKARIAEINKHWKGKALDWQEDSRLTNQIIKRSKK